MRILKRISAFFLVLLLLFLVSCQVEMDTSNVVTHSDGSSSSDIPDYDEFPKGCLHLHQKRIKDVKPTCVEEGYEDRMMCEDCGAILETTGTILPSKGHLYKNGVCVYCHKNEPEIVKKGTFPKSNVTYTLYTDGELEIRGEGAIPSFMKEENSFFYQYAKVIKKIVIYSGVTNIGNYVFRDLKEVREIYFPSTLKIIGNQAFDGWSLKKIFFSCGIEHIGENNFRYHKIYFLDLPGSLRYVGKGSFDAKNMITMTVPHSIRVFQTVNGQFAGLENLAYEGPKEAFDCLALSKHMKTDGMCALTNIRYNYTDNANRLPYCYKRGQQDGDFTYICYTDKTCYISSYKGTDEHLVIPEKLGEFQVIGIDSKAFEGKTNISKVTLPASLEKIRNEAFLDSSLRELVCKGNRLEVGFAAFKNCRNFNKIIAENSFAFTDVGASAFVNTSVNKIPLSSEMKVARASSFAESDIRDVNFQNFEIIADSAFGYTDLGGTLDLTGVKEIGRGAFYRSKTEYVNLTGVKYIGEGAFHYNSNLKRENITGMESLEQVHENAFDFKL